MTQEWVDDDNIFSLMQIITGRCDTTDRPNLAVWMSEDKDTNIFSVYLFIYLLEFGSQIWGGMTLITNSRKWHTRDNTSSGADGSNRNLSWNMWEVWLIPFFSHRRVWMPCLTHKQRTSLTETRPFHLQNIGKRKVSSALLLLNQHVKQWK